jgi:sarcosine oxidase
VELGTRGGRTLRADRVLLAAGGFTNAARLLERRLALSLFGVTVVLVEAPREPRPEIPSVTFVLGSEEAPRTGFAMPPLRYPDGRFYLKCATAAPSPPRCRRASAPGTRGAARTVRRSSRCCAGSAGPGAVRGCGVMPHAERFPRRERVGVAVGCNACGVMTSDEIGRLAAAMMRDAPWTGPLPRELFTARFA